MLAYSFESIILDIVTPIYREVYPDLADIELVNIQDVRDNVVVFIMGAHDMTRLGKDDSEDFSIRITEFAEKKQKILNGVRWAIYPTMKESLLEQHDLNAEQFLVKTVDVKVIPTLFASHDTGEEEGTPDYAADISFSVHVEFHLTIEDISTLEPEGEESIRLRLLNLCSEDSRYPIRELRHWARDLGVRGSDVLQRGELCAAIRQHYV